MMFNDKETIYCIRRSSRRLWCLCYQSNRQFLPDQILDLQIGCSGCKIRRSWLPVGKFVKNVLKKMLIG